jgi:hypothetical protein
MSKFHRMVSLERTPEEKAEERLANSYPTPIADMPDVPYGLCINLTEVELAKLGLDLECDVGDMVHLFCMARVTGISKTDTASGCKCNVNLAITDMAVEDEDEEEAA